MKFLLKLITILLPWNIKKIILAKVFNYKIGENCKIGFSWVFPQFLEMKEGSRITSLTTVINIENLIIGRNSIIERNNWITGFPKRNKVHFSHKEDRDPSLYLGDESAITKKHHIDCTDYVRIGNYTTIAGYLSQFLTHSVNLLENHQDCNPIEIGNYVFVGTNCIFLGGTKVPDFCIVGAKSMVNKSFHETYNLIGGNPSRVIKKLSPDYKYFTRTNGAVI